MMERHACPTAGVTTISRPATWPLLVDVIANMLDQGDLDSDPVPYIDARLAAELGTDHITPAIDEAEALLRKMWSCEPGRTGQATSDELDVPALHDACHDADLPHHISGFVEAVATRGHIPAAFLNTLTRFDLQDVEEKVEQALVGLAYELREIEQGDATSLSAAA